MYALAEGAQLHNAPYQQCAVVSAVLAVEFVAAVRAQSFSGVSADRGLSLHTIDL